jgi:nicotinamide mononucleotide transporter
MQSKCLPFYYSFDFMEQFWEQFVSGIYHTSILEYIAVFTGIASVWFSRNENIWVYPVGLASTIPSVYICFVGHLIGEASVNIYYSILSIYGWILWAQKDERKKHVLHITYSNKKEWPQQLLFGGSLYVIIFLALIFLKKYFYPGAIPWIDAFASATAYTGMWLMAKKKVESWYWWIATNIASIPLYFIKGLALFSLFYLVLLVMAFWGLNEWKRRANSVSKQAFDLQKA